MTMSFDTFNATNPAFTAITLHEFTKAYVETAGKGVDFPTLFLPIPIVLSDALKETFTHTNKNTGFFEWLNRSPEVMLNLDDRLSSTVKITQQAIRFGLQAKLIRIDDLGQFRADMAGIKIKPSLSKYKIIANNLSRAKRLGHWVGGVYSTSTVFTTLRIAVEL
ncbi:three component ABC system middle component [Azospirillum doebereinerae]|uniref:three component ABC system middle component n=1 Tax=Azospirillum doebereinerae TaxID=92933 RepID=UPI001EE56B2A|nr:three component ABC system middle component [Azospirillum doebereinerae]MCG5240947.1 DUF6521 family protein [Azospirillum doebereinerae]